MQNSYQFSFLILAHSLFCPHHVVKCNVNFKKEAMKTRNFTLYAAILVMATGLTAAGQPERGERNGNHENNNRRELKSTTSSEKSEGLKSTSGVKNNEREITGNRNHTVDNPTNRRESVNAGRQMETRETRNTGTTRRSYSLSGPTESKKNAVTKNNSDNNSHKEYTYNRNYRENPAPYYRSNERNVWGKRNYSRPEWEQRQYNWNDHHWDFSNYYRKGHVPYYFRNNNHYWYFPEYGHILRGFRHEPVIFYSGRMPYYFEDGFFYRYYSGIGYVWIEEPYGIWFNELPYAAVRVRIGGKMYYRLGNAFFRHGHGGFHLVVVPDRFYDRNYDRGVSFEVSTRF
jgi:hypothetical protein